VRALTPRRRTAIALLALAAGTAAGVAVRRRRAALDEIEEEVSEFASTIAPGVPHRRAEDEQGDGVGLAIDISQLRRAGEDNAPAVEYLEYIQVQRGNSDSLLFVRREDVGALATIYGLTSEDLESRFRSLGVIYSHN